MQGLYYFVLGFLIITQASCLPSNDFKFSDCFAPHTRPGGACKAHMIRFHWNQALRSCEQVVYGGCRATKNNFLTLEECESTAGAICPYP